MSEVAGAGGVVDVSAVIDGRRLGGFQWMVIGLCGLVALMEGFDTQAVGFVAPVLSRAFHLAPGPLGLFFSISLVGLMSGSLFIAPLADRIGRKPVILACVAMFGLASLGVATASAVTPLFVFRLLTGLGIGGAAANLIALTSEYCPSRTRSFTVMLMFSGFSLGAICAGLAAARLLGPYGWASVFWVGGIAPLLFLPVLAVLLPESIRVLALSEAERPRVARLLARLAPDLPVAPDARFIAEAVSAPRMSVAELFRHGRGRRTVLLWVVFFMSLVDLYLLSNWLTTTMNQRGFPPSTAALIGLMQQVGGMFATFPLGWLSTRREPTRVLVGAYAFGALCLAAIGFTGSNPAVIALVVFGAGMGVVGGQAASNALAATLYPTAVRSTGVGWALGVGRCGAILGPVIGGFLLAAHVSVRDVFLLAALPALVAALAALAIGRTRPAD